MVIGKEGETGEAPKEAKARAVAKASLRAADLSAATRCKDG